MNIDEYSTYYFFLQVRPLVKDQFKLVCIGWGSNRDSESAILFTLKRLLKSKVENVVKTFISSRFLKKYDKRATDWQKLKGNYTLEWINFKSRHVFLHFVWWKGI